MIDMEKLKTFKATNPAVGAILQGLSTLRQRNKAKSNIITLKRELKAAGYVFTDKEYALAWHSFEELGICKLLIGEKGMHVEWKTRLTELGHIGSIGDAPAQKPIKPPSTRAMIILPMDATEEEIKRAKKLIGAA
jgi:hypothetical protein